MIKIFISHADEDSQFCHELEEHLATLRNSGRVETWTVEKIEAGIEWAAETQAYLEAAQMIVFLVSPPFLASIPERPEFAKALDRHRNRTARVVPVIIRPCDWRDGKIDKLHCLCRDKPVSSHGRDKLDRDPAWLYVVEEFRRMIDRGPDAPPEVSAVRYEGAALPYLCDRFPQETSFIERFSTGSEAARHVFFLPGPDSEMHASFVRRIEDWTIPEELREQESIVRVPSLWLQGAPKGKAMELDFVKRKLALALSAHPALEDRILIVEHNLYAKWWSDAMPALIRDYVGFWTDSAPAKAARTMIFFHVIFQAGSVAGQILGHLDELAKALDGNGVSASRLDMLESVQREDVDQWISVYQKDRPPHEGASLLEELFKAASALPMNQVEPRLRKFIDEN